METINPYENEILEKMPDALLRPGGFLLTKQLLTHASLPPGAKILDIGCGLGGTVRFLALEGFYAVGIDKSELIIERGRELFPEIELNAARGEALPMPDTDFDGVLYECSLSLMDADRALGEARRVLKPGGRMMVSDVFAGVDGVNAGGMTLRTVPEFTELLVENGFAVTHTEDKTLVFESFIAQLIMSTGTIDTLFDCCEWSVIKKARPRYVIVCAQKV